MHLLFTFYFFPWDFLACGFLACGFFATLRSVCPASSSEFSSILGTLSEGSLGWGAVLFRFKVVAFDDWGALLGI